MAAADNAAIASRDARRREMSRLSETLGFYVRQLLFVVHCTANLAVQHV
jgi:hypothetical protein